MRCTHLKRGNCWTEVHQKLVQVVVHELDGRRSNTTHGPRPGVFELFHESAGLRALVQQSSVGCGTIGGPLGDHWGTIGIIILDFRILPTAIIIKFSTDFPVDTSTQHVHATRVDHGVTGPRGPYGLYSI